MSACIAILALRAFRHTFTIQADKVSELARAFMRVYSNDVLDARVITNKNSVLRENKKNSVHKK